MNPGRLRAAWLLLAPAASTAAFRWLLPARSDYAGHFLAGWGGTLGLAWVAARIFRGRPGGVLAAVAAAVLLGAGLEGTVFALSGFDLLDFGSQSAGAALAGLAIVELRSGDPEDDPSEGRPFARNGTGALVLAASGAALVVGGMLAFA